MKKLIISTHALTEGDHRHAGFLPRCDDFNSRPHGGRQGTMYGAYPPFHFNSRPHGGRQKQQRSCRKPGKFQLTPSRRATHCHDPAPLRCRFQLTPSRRATVGVVCLSVTAGFQLTPSRRATSPSGTASRSFWISTHALTEGDDFFY